MLSFPTTDAKLPVTETFPYRNVRARMAYKLIEGNDEPAIRASTAGESSSSVIQVKFRSQLADVFLDLSATRIAVSSRFGLRTLNGRFLNGR
jgi:hypothetical protein